MTYICRGKRFHLGGFWRRLVTTEKDLPNIGNGGHTPRIISIHGAISREGRRWDMMLRGYMAAGGCQPKRWQKTSGTEVMDR